MNYKVVVTSRFKKDIKLDRRQGRNLTKLEHVIMQLAGGYQLDIKYRDHELSGDYKGCRECHIESDWLLIYEYIEDELVLMLNRIGTHSQLFDCGRSEYSIE